MLPCRCQGPWFRSWLHKVQALALTASLPPMQVLPQVPGAPQAALHQRLPPTPFDMPAPYSGPALEPSAAPQPQSILMPPGSGAGLDTAGAARLVEVVLSEVVAGRVQLSQAVNVLSSILPAGAPATGHLNQLLALAQQAQAQAQARCQVQQQQQQGRVAPAPAGAGDVQGQPWQGSAMEGQWLQPPTGWGL